MKVRPAQYSVLLVVEANPGRSQQAVSDVLGIERASLPACCMSWNAANGSHVTPTATIRARIRFI